MLKIISKFLIISGILLFIIASYGEINCIHKPSSKSLNKLNLNAKLEKETFSPKLWYKVKSLDDLYKLADNEKFNLLSSKDKMKILFDLITQNFLHKEAKHTLTSNYILFLLGQINDSFLHIFDPNILLSKVYYGFCDQQSYVLLRLAQKFGFSGRHVGMSGHVVVEIYYNNEFHLYDPDLEVIPEDKNGKVLSIAKLIQNDFLLQKYYTPHAINIFKNIKAHNYIAYPKGGWFTWTANLLYYFEFLMEYVKFILPILLIIVGMYLKKIKSTIKALNTSNE